MPIEPVVKSSILHAVSEANQPASLSQRLISWLDEISDGKTHLGNADDTPRSYRNAVRGGED
jgi:hypothetical protein